MRARNAHTLAVTLFISLAVSGCCWLPFVHPTCPYSPEAVSRITAMQDSLPTIFTGRSGDLDKLHRLHAKVDSEIVIQSNCQCNENVVGNLKIVKETLADDSVRFAQQATAGIQPDAMEELRRDLELQLHEVKHGINDRKPKNS